MKVEKAIKLLEQYVEEAKMVLNPPINLEDVKKYLDNFEVVIEAAFGKKSEEYRKLSPRKRTGNNVISKTLLFAFPWEPSELDRYIKVSEYIIRRYEILGKEQAMQDSKTTPIVIFNAINFHPKVIEVSRGLFQNTHYKQAIQESCIALINLVREKTEQTDRGRQMMEKYRQEKGKNPDGSSLMSKVFGGRNPIIKINELLSDSDRDEQQGFCQIYMGVVQGIRNPKSHENIEQDDPYITL